MEICFLSALYSVSVLEFDGAEHTCDVGQVCCIADSVDV